MCMPAARFSELKALLGGHTQRIEWLERQAGLVPELTTQVERLETRVRELSTSQDVSLWNIRDDARKIVRAQHSPLVL